jgi:hypothetical protein
VQFRIGNGTWNNVTYETPLEELEAGQPFNWTVVLDLSQVEAGNQTIEVRTLGSAGHSLPVTISVIGKSTGLELGGGDKVLFIVALTLLVIVAGGFAYRSSIEEGVQFSRGVREDAAVSKSTTDAGKDASSNEKTYGAGNGEVLEADLA